MLKQSIVDILKNNKEKLLSDFIYNEDNEVQMVAEDIYNLFTAHVVSHKEKDEDIELFEPEDNELEDFNESMDSEMIDYGK
jgi:hypothetical protein